MIACYLAASAGPGAARPDLDIQGSRVVGIGGMHDGQIAVSLESCGASPFAGAGIRHFDPAPPGSAIVRAFPAVEVNAITAEGHHISTLGGDGDRPGHNRAEARPGRPVGADGRRSYTLIIESAGSIAQPAHRAIGRHGQAMIGWGGGISQRPLAFPRQNPANAGRWRPRRPGWP